MFPYLNRLPVRSRNESPESLTNLKPSSITPPHNSDPSKSSEEEEKDPSLQVSPPKRPRIVTSEPSDESETSSPHVSPQNSRTSLLDTLSTPSGRPLERFVHPSPASPSIATFSASRPRQPILASALASPGNSEVTFFISSTRPATSLSSGQGDHVTAFATFIELLYNSTHNKENAEEIISGLHKIINAIFSQDVVRDFEKMHTTFTEEQSKLLSRKSRKLLTSFMRESSGITLRGPQSDELRIDDEAVSQIKTSLKFAEVSYIANFIVQIGSELISKLNSLEDMALRREEDPQAPQTPDALAATKQTQKEMQGAQGSVVKQALYTLRLINLLKTAQNLKDANELTKFENLMADISVEINESNSTLKQGLKNIISDITRRPASDEVLNPYLKDTSRMLSLLSRHPDLIAATIGKKIGKLFDFKCQDGRQTNTLCNLLARHLVIIFNTFVPLQSYMKNDVFRDIIMNTLVGIEVINTQGWGKVSSETTPDEVHKSIVSYLNGGKLINLEDFTLTDHCKLKTTKISSATQEGELPHSGLAVSRRGDAPARTKLFSPDSDQRT